MSPEIGPGARVGPYDIVGWLGAGGMGEVYRARDARLGRDVAIKLIAQSLATDPARVQRFEQEARAAGQLSHPNILAVYDTGVHAGIPYIVSELLEGESLRARLRAGPMAPRRAAEYARQIAEGLAAAHDRGVVHRDVKPDNLFVTSDGRIKILDFGVAKLSQSDEEAVQDIGAAGGATDTAVAGVVGTAAYMSPEQVRGVPVDSRSDIFSVGSVLYEMLVGQPAFVRETPAETMTAILNDEPADTLPSSVPPALARIVSRCLEKPREARFQSARDLAFGLDLARGSTGTAPAAPLPVSGRLWPAFRTAVVIASLGLAAASWLRPARQSDNPLAGAQFSRFTDWDGMEGGAEISPDGKFVAFKADHDGQIDLWVKQVGVGSFRNLTQDIPPLSLPGHVRTFGFSGDGSEIWFAEGGDSSAPKWFVPVTGGALRPFMGRGTAAPSFSPDDTRLAYFTNGNGDPISIADRTSADARPLVVDKPGFFAGTMHNHNPVWSPDGQWIYFAHGPDFTEEMNVWRVRPSGGAPEQLTDLRAPANHLALIDQRTVLYVAPAEDGSGPWLWSLDVETKATRRVISGVEHYSSVSASRDGRRVVATMSNPTAGLWRVPLTLDGVAEDRDVQPYALPSEQALSPRFSRTSLFYLSRGGGDRLRRFQDGKSSEVWKAANDSLSEPPAVSPDGTRVVIIVRQQGKLRLLMMSADGTKARTLAPSITIESSDGYGSSADWSPDAAWIVAAGTDAQGRGLFKIPADGGVPVRLVSDKAINPVWSPKNDLIVYSGPSVGGIVPLLGVRPDGTRVELPDVRTGLSGHRFLPNGTGLVYMPRIQSRDFWLLDLGTKRTRPLAHLNDHGSVRAFDITPDGKEIVFDRVRDNSDIVLIDLPKPGAGAPGQAAR
jgi:serine/threonine protein kinase/Tol biopolymer transport system component